MNKCIDTELQEMLPDLLHGALDVDARHRVDAHLATCESCKDDLEVLRAVKSAAVFAPTIDAGSIVRQIPPYRMIVPVVQQPKRTRMVSWLVAAGFALAVVGGGTWMASNQSPASTSVARSSAPVISSPARVVATTRDSIVGMPGHAEVVLTSGSTPTLALASSADLASLSDGDLVQLMDDMDNFDALPAAEPEPVIAVDAGDSI
jgi:anti-sigma factor RsiW